MFMFHLKKNDYKLFSTVTILGYIGVYRIVMIDRLNGIYYFDRELDNLDRDYYLQSERNHYITFQDAPYVLTVVKPKMIITRGDL